MLAHAYVREDHVLDEELPLWVPIPALAESAGRAGDRRWPRSPALGYELQAHLRTGTVASTDNRNWGCCRRRPLERASRKTAPSRWTWRRHHRRQRFSLPRPLRHPAVRQRQTAARRNQAAGMANHFYRERVNQHLLIGIRAIELMREAGQIIRTAASCGALPKWRFSSAWLLVPRASALIQPSPPFMVGKPTTDGHQKVAARYASPNTILLAPPMPATTDLCDANEPKLPTALPVSSRPTSTATANTTTFAGPGEDPEGV